MPPKKASGKKGKGGKPAGGEGPTSLATVVAFENALRQATVAPSPLPRGAKRDEFKDTRRMKRLRKLPERRRLDPRDTTLLRNNRPSYREANSGYMRGDVARVPCGRCANGEGTQNECVLVDGEFDGSW